MTEEEIENLKPGDILRVTYKVQRVGEIFMTLHYQSGADYGICYINSPMARQLELVQPAPTFEVGDTVRIVPDPLTGTVHNSYGSLREFEGLIVTLSWLNKSAGQVIFERDGKENEVSIHCIELAKKAVKDRFHVEEDRYAFIVAEGAFSMSAFYKGKHPNAEAAAKAECDRLNAEWRKQQEST